MQPSKNIFSAILYFILSTIITWYFIEVSDLYEDKRQKFISASVAGGKWLLQILAAYFLLKEKKWAFIKNISLTCLIGSLILVPYCLLGGDKIFFLVSLIISVISMILHYRVSVLNADVSLKWYYGWLICLAIAIILQLTVVFHVL